MKNGKKDKRIILVGVLVIALIVVIVMLFLCQPERSLKLYDALYAEQINLDAINIEAAWVAGLTGENVKIAVIDTGVNSHEDLDEKRISGKCYVDTDESDYADVSGHGTFIVGLLAAEKGNGSGIAGLTDSEIVVLKVVGDKPHIGIGHVAQAIRDAVDMGCDVINISMGTPLENDSLRDAVEYAIERDVIIVAATGGNEEELYYPAAYEGVIGVDALTADLEPTQNAVRNESVFVTAPGEKIISLNFNGGYERNGAGASYAATQVTAFAAYAKQIKPDISPASFMELLKESVSDKGDEGYDTTYGWGVIDAELFVAATKTLR